MSALARASLKLRADLAVTAPESLDHEGLLQIRAELGALSDLLTSTYLR